MISISKKQLHGVDGCDDLTEYDITDRKWQELKRQNLARIEQENTWPLWRLIISLATAIAVIAICSYML